ncbi:MAG TPA: hypothetical protein VI230_05655 [Ignavibacteriaceae bacterium]
MLRFFHIALAAAYFFCCSAEIIGAQRISTAEGRSFTSSNKFPASAQYVPAYLPKHIHSLNHINVDVLKPDIHEKDIPLNPTEKCNCVFSADKIFTLTLESPLNKAPPIPLQ